MGRKVASYILNDTTPHCLLNTTMHTCIWNSPLDGGWGWGAGVAALHPTVGRLAGLMPEDPR